MSSAWLTCCAREEYARLLAEVRARDEHASVLRFGDVSDISRMIAEFPSQGVSAAFSEGCGEERAILAVEEIARSGRAEHILVLSASQDPAVFARLFYAGATEVIAAGSLAEPSIESIGACAERGPNDAAAAQPARNSAPAPPPEPPKPPDAEGYSQHGPWRGPERFRELAGKRAPSESGGGAPVVVAISGRGGVGKSTLVASLACCAAHMGLRAAVVDADLMFGNQYDLLGVDSPVDLGVLLDERVRTSPEAAAEASAMRIAPGLTLWGPLQTPEMAEMMAAPVEGLVGVLRGVADVVFVDTSTFWGDCMASLVASCDRCLVVGGPGGSAVSSSVKAMGLASRLGVSGTRMTGVFNRFGGEGAGEEQAMRYEMGVALHSRVRIADGGEEVCGMASFGHLDSLLMGPGAFATSVRAFARDLLRELGCAVESETMGARDHGGDRPRIRLPWKKRAGDAA